MRGGRRIGPAPAYLHPTIGDLVMRLARTLFALAALATATACSEGASGITAPTSASRETAPGGGWVGSDNVAPTDTTGRGGTWVGTGNVVMSSEGSEDQGGGWGGSGNVAATDTAGSGTTSSTGGWVGSDNVAPVDSASRGGGWVGSDN